MPTYEAVIGLEVHVQLKMGTKIFCRCPSRFGAEPNTLICPVCVGYPGALPVLDDTAVDLAVKLALALDLSIPRRSLFARKSYFYPDLPKGYQITQHGAPLARNGRLPLSGSGKTIGIERLHLEEDTGKLLQAAGCSHVDYNRSGVGLVEIVSHPDMEEPEEAEEYLRTLHRLLLHTGVSDGNLQEGSLRCDANVSVRPPGNTSLGPKTEIKNLNSFRNVSRALRHEIERHQELLGRGEDVLQETRGYDAETDRTFSLRTKEAAPDYRYFPEPDLPPLELSSERIDHLREGLGEPPWELEERLVRTYALSEEDAHLMARSPELAWYFERAATATEKAEATMVADWVRTEVLAQLRDRATEIAHALSPERLGELIELIARGEVSRPAAKRLLNELWTSDESPRQALRRLDLGRVDDVEQLEAWVEEVLREHPVQVARYRDGEEKLLSFFMGQVMRRSRGRADPHHVREILVRQLGTAPDPARGGFGKP